MSRNTRTTPAMLPSWLMIGDALSSIGVSVPLRATRMAWLAGPATMLLRRTLVTGTFHGLAVGLLVDDLKHLVHRSPDRFFLGPAGEPLERGGSRASIVLWSSAAITAAYRDAGRASVVESHASPLAATRPRPASSGCRPRCAQTTDSDARSVASESVPSEHRPDADQAILDDQRITREGDHPLAQCPILGGDQRVTDYRVAQVGPALLGNPADLVLPDWNPAVRSVGVQYIPARSPLSTSTPARFVEIQTCANAPWR